MLPAQGASAADASFAAVFARADVRAARERVVSRTRTIARDLITLGAIESPSGKEAQRAQAVARMMREIGLVDVQVDSMPNVTGRIKGGSGRAVVFVSTLDDLGSIPALQKAFGGPPRLEGDRVVGPWTNTSSTTVAMLAAAEALVKRGVVPEHDIVFAAVAQEETGLVGMKALYAQWKARADLFVDILGDGRSPLPELIAGRDRLIAAGATVLAMPCNTAHFWFSDLSERCPVPFISIVDTCIAELAPVANAGASIGIIATRATLTARIFDTHLVQAGYTPLIPDDDVMHELVLPGIEFVKVGQAMQGGQRIAQAVQSLLDRGAGAVVLACTETPLALDAVQSPLRTKCVDSTAALARACVAWWRLHRHTGTRIARPLADPEPPKTTV